VEVRQFAAERELVVLAEEEVRRGMIGELLLGLPQEPKPAAAVAP
jgi:hypothetical protein